MVEKGEEEEKVEDKSSSAEDRRWFLVSDSHVSEVSEERVLKSQLIYSSMNEPCDI